MSLVASCQLRLRPPSSSSTEHYVGPTVLCKVHDRQDNRRLPEIFLLLEVICLALWLNFQCTSTAPSRVVVGQIMMWLALWASFDSTHPLLDKCTPSLWKFFVHVWNSHNSVWEIKTSGLICHTVISSVCLDGVPCCWSRYQIVSVIAESGHRRTFIRYVQKLCQTFSYNGCIVSFEVSCPNTKNDQSLRTIGQQCCDYDLVSLASWLNF